MADTTRKPWWGMVRTGLAILLTLVVLGFGYAHLLIKSQNDASAAGSVYALMLTISVADFGQWLSGVAGALAFIWLVFAYFQQSEELSLQRVELSLQRAETKRLADEAEKQSNALQIDARLVEQDVALKVADVAERAVRAAADLIISRIRSHHGRTPQVQTDGTNFTLRLPDAETQVPTLTYLLTQLERPEAGFRSAWAMVLKNTPGVSSDVARITRIASALKASAARAGIEDLYADADFLRLSDLLRLRVES